MDDDGPGRSPGQPQPLPRRHRGRQGRLLPQGRAGARPAVGAPLAQPAREHRARPASTSSIDGAPALVWAANFAGFEIHPWTSTAASPDEPSYALDRHRSGHGDDVGRDADDRPPVPRRDRQARPRRPPEGHRQARHPDLDPGQARLLVQRDLGVRRGAVADGRRRRAASWSAGSGRRAIAAARPASTTRRTRSTRRSSRRTASARPPARRCRCRWSGTSSTTRKLRPDRWTIRDVLKRLETVGDPFDALVGQEQALPLAARRSGIAERRANGVPHVRRERTRVLLTPCLVQCGRARSRSAWSPSRSGSCPPFARRASRSTSSTTATCRASATARSTRTPATRCRPSTSSRATTSAAASYVVHHRRRPGAAAADEVEGDRPRDVRAGGRCQPDDVRLVVPRPARQERQAVRPAGRRDGRTRGGSASGASSCARRSTWRRSAPTAPTSRCRRSCSPTSSSSRARRGVRGARRRRDLRQGAEDGARVSSTR